MQKLCDHLSQWCINNKLVINCDVNKTEAIILSTNNPTSHHTPPELIINNKTIRYVKQTRVLGLIVDDELNFKEHAQQKLKECNKKWGLITRSTNRNQGLNVRSLTLLLKTTVLTKIHYAAPLWLKENLEVYRAFWNNVIMKVTGAMFNPHRELTELVLHLPPLEIQVETLTVKFLCKAITGNDFISSLLLQIEGTANTELCNKLMTVKRFLIWKDSTHGSTRTPVRNWDILTHGNPALPHYTKEEIQLYQQKIWAERIINRTLVRNHTSSNDEKASDIARRMKAGVLLLDKDNFIFNNNTTKAEDSYIMDYLLGSSDIFGSTRSSIDRDASLNVCYFCNNPGDTPEHQLLNCKEVKEHTHSNLKSLLQNDCNYVEEIVENAELQKPFIDRIVFLKGQHEFILDPEDLAINTSTT